MPNSSTISSESVQIPKWMMALFTSVFALVLGGVVTWLTAMHSDVKSNTLNIHSMSATVKQNEKMYIEILDITKKITENKHANDLLLKDINNGIDGIANRINTLENRIDRQNSIMLNNTEFKMWVKLLKSENPEIKIPTVPE